MERRLPVDKWVRGALIALAVPGFLMPMADGLRRKGAMRRGEGVDARFAIVRDSMPPGGQVLGYVSDIEDRGLFFGAQYAVAPHLLVEGTAEHRFAVAVLRNAENLPEICRARSLTIVAVDRVAGTALLKSEGAP